MSMLSKNFYYEKIKLILFYSVFLGLLTGISYFVIFVKQNRYLPENLKEIYSYLLQYSINRMTIIWFFAALFITIISIVLKKYLHYLYSLFISLTVFSVVGYYLNKNVLPEFYSLKSISINFILFFVFTIISIFFSKYKRLKFDFLKRVYHRLFLTALVAILLAINIFALYQSKDLSLFPIKKEFSDEKFLNLFNLDFPGLEKAKSFYLSGEYEIAADKLLEYYSNRDESTWLFNSEQKAQLDTAYILKRANEAINHKFSIRGLTAVLSKDINWTEPIHNNKEWIYRLNTHFWWDKLAFAYFITRDEKYVFEFNNQLMDWIFDNPVIKWKNESMPTWRLIETGCRLFGGWPLAFQMFSRSKNFSKKNRKLMLATIYNQAQFLRLFKSPQRNHLLFESKGLASAGIFFPEFKNSSVWKKVAFARINHLIDTEINDDGSYIEFATNYHKTIAELFDSIKDLSLRCPKENLIDSTRLHKIESLFDFLAKVSRPDGMLPGVNDGHSVEVRDILGLAAKKYDRPDFRFISSGFRDGQEPAYKSCELPDAGFYVMRTAWDTLANYLFFDAGPFGSAHGHEDKLNIEVYAFGKIFLVDPGTYTYDAKDKYRFYFNRSFSHNTVIVDGKSQVRFWDKNRWVYHDDYKDENIWRSTEKFDFVEAAYTDGYGNYKERVDHSVSHIRRILFVKPNYWVISDILEGEGKHLFQQLFHFMPMEVQKSNSKSVCTINNSEANLAIVPINEPGLQADILTGSEDPLQGWVATGFHRKFAAPAVIFSKKEQAPSMFNVVLYPSREAINLSKFKLERIPVSVNGKTFKQTRAICLKFSTDEWDDFILISKNISGTKKFGNFSSDKDVAYFRVKNGNKIIDSFEFNIKE